MTKEQIIKKSLEKLNDKEKQILLDHVKEVKHYDLIEYLADGFCSRHYWDFKSRKKWLEEKIEVNKDELSKIKECKTIPMEIEKDDEYYKVHFKYSFGGSEWAKTMEEAKEIEHRRKVTLNYLYEYSKEQVRRMELYLKFITDRKGENVTYKDFKTAYCEELKD